MAARIEQAAIVMLAVNLDQQGAELALQAGGDRLVVDEGAAAAVGLDDAADDQRLARLPGEPVLVEQGQRRVAGGDLEGDADRRLPLPAAHQSAVRAHAEREPQSVEQDRFSGAGLAGQHAEARPEFEIERFDQHDVADGESGQHGGGIGHCAPPYVIPAKARKRSSQMTSATRKSRPAPRRLIGTVTALVRPVARRAVGAGAGAAAAAGTGWRCISS